MQRHEFAKKGGSLRAIAFDPASGRVTVEPANGEKRTYGNFTPAEFETWCAAPKPGQWFHENVRMKAEAHPPVVEAVARTEAAGVATDTSRDPAPAGNAPSGDEIQASGPGAVAPKAAGLVAASTEPEPDDHSYAACAEKFGAIGATVTFGGAPPTFAPNPLAPPPTAPAPAPDAAPDAAPYKSALARARASRKA